MCKIYRMIPFNEIKLCCEVLTIILTTVDVFLDIRISQKLGVVSSNGHAYPCSVADRIGLRRLTIAVASIRMTDSIESEKLTCRGPSKLNIKIILKHF